MLPTDVHFYSIAQVSKALAARDFSPLELTQACLERIKKLDGPIHSYITVTEELALEQAKQATEELASGRSRGPLHGVPIALKDLYETKGIRTTGHSKVLEDNVPDKDSTATRLL